MDDLSGTDDEFEALLALRGRCHDNVDAVHAAQRHGARGSWEQRWWLLRRGGYFQLIDTGSGVEGRRQLARLFAALLAHMMQTHESINFPLNHTLGKSSSTRPQSTLRPATRAEVEAFHQSPPHRPVS